MANPTKLGEALGAPTLQIFTFGALVHVCRTECGIVGFGGRICRYKHHRSCRTTNSLQHPSTLADKIDMSTASASSPSLQFILFQPFLQIFLVLPQLLHGLLVLLLQGCSILLLDLGGGLIGGFLIAFFIVLFVKPNNVVKTRKMTRRLFFLTSAAQTPNAIKKPEVMRIAVFAAPNGILS